MSEDIRFGKWWIIDGVVYNKLDLTLQYTASEIIEVSVRKNKTGMPSVRSNMLKLAAKDIGKFVYNEDVYGNNR